MDDCSPLQSVPPRETLGQQLFDNQIKNAGQKTQTIRETTDEMGKKYMEELLSCAQNNLKKYNKDFYILEIIEHDAILEGVIKVHFQPRWTRPNPEWGLSLYKVEAASGDLRYLWGLPRQHEAFIMVQNPEGWESKTMQDIYDFMHGILI
jgi:hypothetical protein